MSELEFEYASNIAKITLDENEKYRELRSEALAKLYSLIISYKNEGFQEKLLSSILKKKGEMIRGAASKKAITEILKPSVPHYNFEGFHPVTEYHVEEEELILWSLASLKGPLMPEAVKRYEELFLKYCSEEGKEIFEKNA